jgi:hypothetical protein
MCFENIIYVDFDLLLQAKEENGLLITTGLKRRRESTTDVSAEIHLRGINWGMVLQIFIVIAIFLGIRW